MRQQLFLFLLLIIVISIHSNAQIHAEGAVSVDLSRIDQLQIERNDKIEAAFTAMEAVQRTGAYIQSLSDLLESGEITLPVGIKKGDYELIIQKIKYDPKTGKSIVYATCAFRFKDTGQKVAFAGYADIQGQKGLGTSGALELIAPVRRNMGKEAAIIFHEGSRVNFGCDGVESFAAMMTWIVTSPNIIAVDDKGNPVNKPVFAYVETMFHNFDDYTVSLNVNQAFSFKGIKDLIFTIKGATLDQSDKETSSLVVFPDRYFLSDDRDEINLWKGVAATEASVSLPAIFKNPASKDTVSRITISINGLLLDANGLTTKAAANNVIEGHILDRARWAISLNDFSFNVFKNELTGFGFGGEMNIPPLGKNSLLPYTATFNPVLNDYEFKAHVAGNFDFPVFKSSMELYETSTVEVMLKGSEIYPTIHANGVLNIAAPINPNDSTKTFTVPGIHFENLVISREKPYLTIGAIGETGNLQSPEIAGFQLLISDIKPFNNDLGSGLAFNAGVTLHEMFGGNTSIRLYGDYSTWKFDKAGVDKVHVEYQSKAFSLKGGVWLKNGDLVYGDGFRGDISLSLLEKFNFDAVGVFGKKDDYRYFLTDVFMEMKPGGGVIIPPALSFYGFGGGLYQRMQQSSKSTESEFGKSLSGIHYVPDKKVGMGVMASAKFALAKSANAFNAKVGFEMQFNQHGGLNFVQLRGDASFMDTPDKWGKMIDNVAGQVQKFEKEGKVLKEASKTDLKTPENIGNGFLTASLNIKYDLINSIFNADLSTYLNAGLITGIGENNRMGWASAYFSPDKWYIYIGTPSDRLGIKVLNLAKMSSYFMLGADIPALPPPPEKVLRNFSSSKQSQLNKRSVVNMVEGNGIAFGMGLDLSFKAKLPPFYASLGVGLGSEFLLVDKKGRPCLNYSEIPGINGWYAQAQAWAYVEAAIGIEARIFRKKRQFNILDISAGTLLEGAGPNPLYFAGAVGGQFSVLGGLIKGSCNFDFEIGEKCISGTGSPFGEDIIAQLTPASEENVNVFAAPQAIFNIPVGVEMTIDEEDGAKGTYMVTLEEFTIRYEANGISVNGRPEMSSDGTVYSLDPTEPFESQKDLSVYVKVSFKQKVGGKWTYVAGDNGKPVYEEKKETFRSGDRPKEILPEHVKYSYPMARQYNFYPGEYKKGYMMLTENYSYLFKEEKPEGFTQLIRVNDIAGKSYETTFTYRNISENGSCFEIDFSMENMPFINNRIYKLAIINVPESGQVSIKSNISTRTESMEGVADVDINKQRAESNLIQLSEKEIYALHFRTSQYNSFADKMAGYDTKAEGWRDYVEPFIHHIKANLKGTERFDKYEIEWNSHALPLVRFEAQTGKTDWYRKSFYGDMYRLYNNNAIQENRIEQNTGQDFGAPPVHAVVIESGETGKLLSDDEIQTGMLTGYNFPSVFCYALPFWSARDFKYVKDELGEKKIRGGGLNPDEIKLMDMNHPPMVTKGSYPVKVKYVLPGKEIETSSVEIEMYNPVE